MIYASSALVCPTVAQLQADVGALALALQEEEGLVPEDNPWFAYCPKDVHLVFMEAQVSLGRHWSRETNGAFSVHPNAQNAMGARKRSHWYYPQSCTFSPYPDTKIIIACSYYRNMLWVGLGGWLGWVIHWVEVIWTGNKPKVHSGKPRVWQEVCSIWRMWAMQLLAIVMLESLAWIVLWINERC